MGVELILLYALLMLVLGPCMSVYGVLVIVRQRIRLTSEKVLVGGAAAVAGVFMILAGLAFSFFLWNMARFFPH
jgi:hypothetical protein